MKILVCAYRDWAITCFEKLQDRLQFNDDQSVNATPSEHYDFYLSTEPEAMEKIARASKWDLIVLIGWSWKIPADIVNSTLVVGMHPSDLPKYAGGSPIQNQIIDGLTESVATLFRLNEKFDEGEIVDKEPFSLKGHLSEVFASISTATFELLFRAIRSYPQLDFKPQATGGFVRKRLKPEQSRLTPTHLVGLTCKQLNDFIRCREDPYPNAYIEDETGKLYIKLVEFEAK